MDWNFQRACFAQAILELTPQRLDVPAQRAICLDRCVRESMDLFERDTPMVDAPEHQAPALRSKVASEIIHSRPRRRCASSLRVAIRSTSRALRYLGPSTVAAPTKI